MWPPKRSSWCATWAAVEGCLKRSLKFSWETPISEEFQEAIPTPQNKNPCIFLGGGNSNIFFYPYLGKSSNLTNIFQRGWNHQLVFVCGCENSPIFWARDPPLRLVGDWITLKTLTKRIYSPNGLQRMGGKWTIWTCISYWKWGFSERKVFILKSEFLGKWTSLWKSLVQRDDRLLLWWWVGGEGLVRCFFLVTLAIDEFISIFGLTKTLIVRCYEIVIGFRKGRRFQQKGVI